MDEIEAEIEEAGGPLQFMKNIEEEYYRDFLNKPDWVLRNVPWLSTEYWNQLLDMFGEGNYQIMSGSLREDTIDGVKTTFHRGYFMLAPEALERIKNALDAQNSQ